MAPWLWWLDEKTGRWRQMGEMKPVNNSRTKRALGGGRFYVGDIQTDKLSYINIDILWKRCFVRAQAYTKTNKGAEPVKGAWVTLIGKENTDQEQYYGYTQGITDENGIACIPAWCDSNVVLQASKSDSYDIDLLQLAPDRTSLEKLSPYLEASVLEGNKSSSFQFSAKVTSHAGPVFGGDELNKCLDLSNDLVAFRFYSKEAPNKLDDFGARPPGHPLAWYTRDNDSKPNQEPNKCFMKIAIQYNEYVSVPMVSVQSFTPNRQTRYGFSMRKLTPTDELPAFIKSRHTRMRGASGCIEYRCSEADKETFLVVTLLTYSCVFPLHIPELLPKRCRQVPYPSSRRSTSFSVPVDISDGKLGLYTGPGKLAEERCKAGGVDNAGNRKGKINTKGYAVYAYDSERGYSGEVCPSFVERPAGFDPS